MTSRLLIMAWPLPICMGFSTVPQNLSQVKQKKPVICSEHRFYFNLNAKPETSKMPTQTLRWLLHMGQHRRKCMFLQPQPSHYDATGTRDEAWQTDNQDYQFVIRQG